MSEPSTDHERFGKTFLILLVAGISVVFFLLVRQFLVTLLLAAIFAGMAQPLYRWILRLVGERRSVASGLTLAFLIFVVLIPFSGFVGIVASQAINISESVRPWVQNQLQQPDAVGEWFSRLPFSEELEPYRQQITAKVGELAGRAGTFLFESVAAFTRGTVTFLLHLFVMLYAMFFFLRSGDEILRKILYYLPLGPEQEDRMVERFLSVSRATIKGTLIIGLIQGALAGGALALAGVQGSAFWGTIMVVLSVIPGLGAAIVWVPAVIYLIAFAGKLVAGVAVAIWCAGVVGLVDNVLRPALVGRDSRMSDLMILISTLGGLYLFGATGFIVGPIVAALFVTIWDIYGSTFTDYLPEPSA